MKIMIGSPTGLSYCDQCEKPTSARVLLEQCARSLVCRDCIEQALALFTVEDAKPQWLAE